MGGVRAGVSHGPEKVRPRSSQSRLERGSSYEGINSVWFP